MDAFKTLTGIAVPFGAKNVDTDVIIPARFLKTIQRAGLGKGAFAVIRENPDNIFDQPRHEGAPILIAGDNFGCGSSREHAPWALDDYGFRVILAPSYGDIFYNNCFKNGLLPVRLSEEDIDWLFAAVESTPGMELVVDLPQQRVSTVDGARVFPFDIDAFRKDTLERGLDEIGLTLRHADAIRAYERKRLQEKPWLARTLAA